MKHRHRPISWKSLAGLVRNLGRAATLLALALPFIALAALALVDSAAGSLGFTPIYLGLGLSPREAHQAIAFSVACAAGATLLATCAGLLLGLALAAHPARHRRFLQPLCLLPAALTPLVLACAAGFWLDRLGVPHPAPSLRITLLIAILAISGMPRVALPVASLLAHIPTAWWDAARAAGLPPHRQFRRLAWPLLRPSILRAAAAVFALSLLDPGAPLILQIEQALSFQIVRAAWLAPPRHLAATLALVACSLIILVSLVFQGWSRRSWTVSAPSIPLPTAGTTPQRPAWLGTLILILWSIGAWLLPLGLLLPVISRQPPNSVSTAVDAAFRFAPLPVLFHTLALGPAAAALAWGLAWCWLAPRHHPDADTPANRARLALGRLAHPLLLATGALALLDFCRQTVLPGQGGTHTPPALSTLLALDPITGHPGLLILVLALGLLPLALAGLREAQADRSSWRRWIDAAVAAGLTRQQAWKRLVAIRQCASDFRWLLLALTAAAEVPASLLLLRSPDHITLAPAIAALIDAGQPLARTLPFLIPLAALRLLSAWLEPALAAPIPPPEASTPIDSS